MRCFNRLLLLLLFGVLSLSAPGALRAEDFARRTPLEQELSRYVVSPATFGRRQLYTWTKPEQIAELRAGQKVLSRRVSSAGEPSRFDLILAEKTFDGFPLAVALRDARFASKRFAWAAAWPTVMGWEKESYGDQLLQITLKDDAIIIAFMPYCEPKFACRNALGQELDEAFVLAHPDKIAVVYFCAVRPGIRTEQSDTTKPVRKEGLIHYREYVVCNEAMIAAWQYAGEETKKEMETEIAFLKSWQAYLMTQRNLPAYSPRALRCYSATRFNNPTMQYQYALAFPNDFCLMSSPCAGQIIAALQAALAAQGSPLSR
ncbi:MAG: hypothetical protein K8R23_11025 [Chthoniobacter sp.]|nr:hypothetical protein [Chthoniobacter sp.]